MTANVIEAGEVVANGFAAQRITTGNLTVTDGAVIAGMTISGGVLTGGNINISQGGKLGKYIIYDFGNLRGTDGAQLELLAPNYTTGANQFYASPGIVDITQTTAAQTAFTVNGGKTMFRCNSVKFYDAAEWRAPGVFYAFTVLSSGSIGRTWGNPDFRITSVAKLGTGRYRVNYSGYNGDVFPMITPLDASKWTSAVVEVAGGDNFVYKTWDSSGILVDCGAVIFLCGMV